MQKTVMTLMLCLCAGFAHAQQAAAPAPAPVYSSDTPLIDNLQSDAQSVRDQATEDYTVIKQNVESDTLLARDNMAARANRMANNARDGIKQTVNKLRDWWLTPLAESQPTPIPSSYCYKALQDVLCYRQPMPGWEHRLVGYQGTAAAPPPVATMQTLPHRTVDGIQQAQNRIENTKPVFVEMPPEVDTDKPASEQSLVPDPAHQTLPNPTQVPQL